MEKQWEKLLVIIFVDNLPVSVLAPSDLRVLLRTGTYLFVLKLFSCYILSSCERILEILVFIIHC